YNEEKTIAGTMKSVFALDYPKNKIELLVVNDGSKDKTLEIAKNIANLSNGMRVTVLTQKNKGKGSAINHAIRNSRGEFVVNLDADSFVASHSLKNMIHYFEDNEVSSVSAIMKVRNPKTLVQKMQWLEYIMYAFVKIILSNINCIHVTPGPFSMYRKSVILKLGGFDEKSTVEDQEIAYRMQKNHYKLAQSYDGDVTTIAPATLKALYTQRNRWFKGSLTTLYDYRSIIFNKKYGDFGMFQLPSIVSGMLLLLVVIIMFINGVVIPVYDNIYHLALLNFDLSLYYNTTFSNIIAGMINSIFSYNYAKLFIMLILFSINLTIIIKAHKYTNEKIKLIHIIPLILFFIVYYIILSFMWIVSIIDLAKNKRSKTASWKK
ncbi:MAG: glycosyltransferase, partial [Candidatus Aenigmarchaeota archaeon]|nr:glycosyltransferase [Candidatus Aenigmarchaeota archaeon]